MHTDADHNYTCPICLAIKGVENEDTWIKQADIFYRDDTIMGFISSKKVCGNEHHPIIVPLEHVENLYELPAELGHAIMDFSSHLARALKRVRGCDGVTVIQNNEPAGDQHAFHYHMHLFPRFNGDSFHTQLPLAERAEPDMTAHYAKMLRDWFAANHPQ